MALNQADTVQAFLLEEATIRGTLVHLNETIKTITAQRDYPPFIEQLLSEALVACAYLASRIKFSGLMTLQFQSDDRFPLLLAQADNDLQLRGMADWQPDLTDEAYLEAFMKGTLVITLRHDAHPTPYQSLVPIESSSLAENLMAYFAQSEQIPSYVHFFTDEHHVGGIFLQLIPLEGGTESTVTPVQRESFWEYAVKIGETIRAHEWHTLTNETLLYRLYHESRVRLFEPRHVVFQCRCNAEKMHNVLRTIGEKESKELLEKQPYIEVTCEFCRASYQLDSIDVELAFKG